MRIVQTSNRDIHWYNERFILWRMPEEACNKICKILNDEEGPNSVHFYKTVNNDYELYIGMKE